MKKYSLLLLPTLLLLAKTDVHCMENINNTLDSNQKKLPPFSELLQSLEQMKNNTLLSTSEPFPVNTTQQNAQDGKRKRIVEQKNNQLISNSQPLQKKRNTSKQSVINPITAGSSSSSSQSITTGSSSSSSSTTNTRLAPKFLWTGHPPAYWNQKRWNSHTINEKAQIIAAFLEDAKTSTKMLDEINDMLNNITQSAASSLKWFFNPMENSKDSVVQQAINKNNPTGLLHLKFILNLLINKINSLEDYYSRIRHYKSLTKNLKACTTNNTTIKCSTLINDVISTIKNISTQLYQIEKTSSIFNALNQLLNGPTQLSNSLNASSSSQNQLLPAPTPPIQPQTTTTITQNKDNDLTADISDKDLIKMVNALPSIFPTPTQPQTTTTITIRPSTTPTAIPNNQQSQPQN